MEATASFADSLELFLLDGLLVLASPFLADFTFCVSIIVALPIAL